MLFIAYLDPDFEGIKLGENRFYLLGIVCFGLIQAFDRFVHEA